MRYFWKKAVKIAEALGTLLSNPRCTPASGATPQTPYLLLLFYCYNFHNSSVLALKCFIIVEKEQNMHIPPFKLCRFCWWYI